MQQFRAVLDFGCGCGRIIRHWKDLKGPVIYGSDYNPQLVEFCRRALPFARFSVNRLRSPLDYEDSTFDFIYAISVFTHLEEGDEDFWIGSFAGCSNPVAIFCSPSMVSTVCMRSRTCSARS